jgi:two-component system, OmpR family, alkaline phosphatase synthesis response regulator PhoP
MAKADIMIVEDHPTMREAMRLILEHEGFEIREAPDGAAALAMVREQPPDLMFLDLNIPGTSGAAVLAELKGDPATKDVRVIIVTATGEEGRDFVLSLGADEYFTKPFSPTALLRTVERVLQASSSEAIGPDGTSRSEGPSNTEGEAKPPPSPAGS